MLTDVQRDSLSALKESCLSNKSSFTFFLGFDDDKRDSSAVNTIRDILGADRTKEVFFAVADKGAICKYWKILAKTAYDYRCDYFCLLGDDIKMHSLTWMDDLAKDFETLSTNRGLPLGFGCVAITDTQAPGFPTFPVVGRLHYDFMNGELFSDDFINQDADPFLFQLYRRFGASVFSRSVSLTNGVGGVQVAGDANYLEPRYIRKHIDWSGSRLTEAVIRVQKNLHTKGYHVPLCITVDVVVPTYRVEKTFLSRICDLKCSDPNVDLNFIVIVDNPDADISFLDEMVKTRFDLRVRVNPENKGASFTRNVGINESAAEWILFLDDDVIPDHSIVDEYIEAIRIFGGQYDGFVGYSELPYKPNGVFATAVHLSGVSFFWRGALKMKEMPWGITANLLVRRTVCKPFDESYIKTGGGEDIDFCLQLPKQPLRAVPSARVEHPWWDNGARCYKHFFYWSFSDGILQDRYPGLTYRCLPDAVEFTVLSVSIVMSLKMPWLVALSLPVAILLADAGMDFLRLWADPEAESYSVSTTRVLAILESTLIKNVSCLGHFWGHIRRGHFFNICKRFDWFCGLDASVVAGEQLKASNYFAAYTIAAMAVIAAVANR